MTPAAIYCRSSKDRAEIGLDTQRKELRAYAEANGLRIVDEYSDMEISGSLDEVSRPGLRKLLASMAAPGRKWSVLLAVDTSRIARDLALALAIQRECDRHGVDLRYSKVAVDSKTPAGEMFLTLDRAVSQYHSRISAQKGRAGMETNISAGHRAGGKAPLGYKLEHVDTGGTRGGAPVYKSRLVLDPRAAKKVRAFLRQRADGTPRHIAAKTARLGDKSQGSLIAIERNALTYAGFTVWNQRRKHRPTKEDARRTMIWRSRAEWIISPKPTHEALITRQEADRILAAVDRDNPKPRGFHVRKPDQFLLTGLLYTPNGKPWQGDGMYYRVATDKGEPKGKRILRAAVDEEVLLQIAMDINNEEFVGRVVQEAHEMADAIEDSPAVLDQALRSVEAKIKRMADAVAETGLGSLGEKLKTLEAERARLQEERATTADRAKLKAAMRALTTDDVADMLVFYLAPVENWEEPEKTGDVRRTLAALVQRIELDPATRGFDVHYHLPATGGVKVASPRGFEPRLPP